MAYKINITNKEISDNKVKVAFEVKSGNKVEIKHELKVANEAQLKSEIRKFLQDFENSKDLVNIPLGDFDISEVVVAQPDPTPDQIKKEAFNKKMGELRTAKQYLDLGLIDQAEYDLVKEEAKTLGEQSGELKVKQK